MSEMNVSQNLAEQTNQNNLENEVYYFPQGIPGFESLRDFRLIQAEEGPLAQLIAVEDENIGFILLRPEAVFPAYLSEIEIDEETKNVLKINEDAKIDVWVILTLNHKDMAQTTANLRAPILLNPQEKLGVQFILAYDSYSSREPIFSEKDPKALQEGAEG